jgi:hypothetical protein
MFALRVFWQTLAGVVGGAWHAFAIITVIFAVLERSKANLNSYGENFLDQLPETPQKSEKIGIGEPIVGILMCALLPVLFLGVPQIMGGMSNGIWIPLFDVAVLRSLWIPIIVWAILGVIAETVTILEGRYTKRLAIVSIVTNLLIVVCAATVFLNNSVMNPDFVYYMSGILNYEADWLIPWLSSSNIIVFVVVCVIVVIESVSLAVKAWRYDK